MTRRPLALRALATTLVAATALTLGIAPAHAAVYNHDDAVGDVRGADFDTNDPRFTPRPEERAADITELRVRHGAHRLTMRLETVDLTRQGSLLIGPAFVVTTPRARYTANVSAFSFRKQNGRDVSLSTGRGRGVRCAGLFADFDFAGDVSMLSVPRRCLGNPRRVTVRAAMVKFTDGFGEVKVDSAMDDRRVLPLRPTPGIRSAAVTAR